MAWGSPVILIVAFSGVIPLMTVVNYSVQDILDFNTRFFVGFEWYLETRQTQGLLMLFYVNLALVLLFLQSRYRWAS